MPKVEEVFFLNVIDSKPNLQPESIMVPQLNKNAVLVMPDNMSGNANLMIQAVNQQNGDLVYFPKPRG